MALTLDGITQTLGGLIGALLGSYLSYRAATKTIAHDRNRQKIVEIENFLKSAYLIDRIVQESGLRSIDEINSIMAAYQGEEGLYIKQARRLETQISSVTNVLDQIELIKDETILQPVYESFVKIKWLLILSTTVALIFLNDSPNKKLIEKDNFLVIIRDLKQGLSNLLSYAEERIKELMVLRESSN